MCLMKKREKSSHNRDINTKWIKINFIFLFYSGECVCLPANTAVAFLSYVWFGRPECYRVLSLAHNLVFIYTPDKKTLNMAFLCSIVLRIFLPLLRHCVAPSAPPLYEWARVLNYNVYWLGLHCYSVYILYTLYIYSTWTVYIYTIFTIDVCFYYFNCKQSVFAFYFVFVPSHFDDKYIYFSDKLNPSK